MLEPDRHLRRLLVEVFMTQSYDVTQHADSSDLISSVVVISLELIVLAEDAVDREGTERVRMLRRLTDGIIVITGEGEENEVVAALLGGADIYIRKAINFLELLARVRSARRRGELDHAG